MKKILQDNKFKRIGVCATSFMLASSGGFILPGQVDWTSVVSAQTTQDNSSKISFDLVSAGDMWVSGQTEANATVTLLIDKTSDKVTVDADGEGKWLAELPEGTELVDGDTINLTVTLANGEIATKTITVGLLDHSITVDEISAEARQITGQTSPWATVTVLDDTTGAEWTVDADQTGAFVIELPAELTLAAGQTINITANSTDNQQEFAEITVVDASEGSTSQAGSAAETDSSAETWSENEAGSNSETESVSEDMLGDTAIENQVDSNHILEVSQVAEGDQVVSGQTSPQATVVVLSETTGDKWTVDADNQGAWTVELPQALAAGETLSVTANSLSNQQDSKEIAVVSSASQRPESATEASSQTTVEESFVAIDPVYEGATSLTGTTNPGATVLIRYDATGDKWTVEADASGMWSVDVPLDLKYGETLGVTSNSLDNQTSYTEATVLANDQTTSQVQENFVKVEDIQADDKMVSGSTLANATVTLLFQSTGDKVTVDADADGNWTAEVPATVSLKAGNLINITSNSLENQQAFAQVKVQNGVTVDKSTTVDSKDQLPDTGESAGLWGIVGAVLVALAGGVFFFNRRNSKTMK